MHHLPMGVTRIRCYSRRCICPQVPCLKICLKTPPPVQDSPHLRATVFEPVVGRQIPPRCLCTRCHFTRCRFMLHSFASLTWGCLLMVWLFRCMHVAIGFRARFLYTDICTPASFVDMLVTVVDSGSTHTVPVQSGRHGNPDDRQSKEAPKSRIMHRTLATILKNNCKNH